MGLRRCLDFTGSGVVIALALALFVLAFGRMNAPLAGDVDLVSIDGRPIPLNAELATTPDHNGIAVAGPRERWKRAALPKPGVVRSRQPAGTPRRSASSQKGRIVPIEPIVQIARSHTSRRSAALILPHTDRRPESERAAAASVAAAKSRRRAHTYGIAIVHIRHPLRAAHPNRPQTSAAWLVASPPQSDPALSAAPDVTLSRRAR